MSVNDKNLRAKAGLLKRGKYLKQFESKRDANKETTTSANRNQQPTGSAVGDKIAPSRRAGRAGHKYRVWVSALMKRAPGKGFA